MDPRVAWIQPEQKGPANALWMHVWETSQGAGGARQLHSHSHFVGYAALDVLKNVATAVASSRASSCRSSSHHRSEDLPQKKTSSVPPSSAQEPDAERLSSPLERTNVTGNFNKNDGSTRLCSREDNLCDHEHLEEQPALSLPQDCGQQVPASLHANHSYSHHPGRRKSDNKASTYGANYCTNGNCPNTWTPWKTRTYKPGVLG